MKKTISISGMHCEHCINAVTAALKTVPGITSVSVSLEKNKAVVEGGVPDNILREAVEDTGFDVTGIK
ncbi:MAG: heavy-metal-associated domain-containing protein [Phascolarctobacterium sp.]|nr:heavy-metal-associated domain-containing protein [Phascolarctobacterium sp.]MCD8175038.1 heavy-metal-associated domain-containing protein [Phascolarctobacterium sp.]